MSISSNSSDDNYNKHYYNDIKQKLETELAIITGGNRKDLAYELLNELISEDPAKRMKAWGALQRMISWYESSD